MFLSFFNGIALNQIFAVGSDLFQRRRYLARLMSRVEPPPPGVTREQIESLQSDLTRRVPVGFLGLWFFIWIGLWKVLKLVNPYPMDY